MQPQTLLEHAAQLMKVTLSAVQLLQFVNALELLKTVQRHGRDTGRWPENDPQYDLLLRGQIMALENIVEGQITETEYQPLYPHLAL